MKRIVNFIKDKRVISIIGVIALVILIWFGGEYVRFGESNYAPLGTDNAKFLAIIVLLLLWGANNLREQYQRNKQNQNLIEGIQESQQQDVAAVPGDQSLEELNILRERFSQALTALKKIKFKGGHGAKVVYELPWYIIIGPPGSGKTTALVNSGLEFPLSEKFGKGALKGIGGTRNCDWWFTNDAVLIDTAGRYTTQDSHRVTDRAAWQGFLELLKKNRPRRPINGAIVAISAVDILTQTDEERITHARIIRTRLDELMEELGVRFPIYFVLTKGDLISGFSEFFEDLSRIEREQVWGATFDDSGDITRPADLDWYSEQYDAIVDRLNDRMLWRLNQERDLNRRGAIENFPQQMEHLKSLLLNFLRQTFAPSRYHFQPYLRGIYFSSGTQDGMPIDRMMSAIAANIGLQREAAHLPAGQGKSYFINRLFKEIIFPEAELVGTNQRFERLTLWMRRVGYVTLSALFAACIVVWIGSVTKNRSLLDEVQTNVEAFNKDKAQAELNTSDLRSVLPSLNALLEASKVYDVEEHPWLVNVGMYDSTVSDIAKQAYEMQLKAMFLPRVKEFIEQYLKMLILQPDKKGDLYDVFRYYYMFKEINHMETEKLKTWIKSQWDVSLHGQASKKGQLVTHLDALLELSLEPSALDDRLVKKARVALLAVPPSRRIYSGIKSNPKFSREVNLVNLFGDVTDAGFAVNNANANTLSMPVLFTKDGYNGVDLGADSDFINGILNDSWVLGEQANEDFRKEDLDEISKEVKDFYLTEYATRWDKALAALNIAKFENLQQGVDVLARFTDPVYSPLLNILKTTSNNTTLSLQAMVDVPAEGSKNPLLNAAGNMASKQLEGNLVDKRYKDLNNLTRENSKRPPPINNIIKSLDELHSYLNEINSNSDVGKASFEAAKARFQGGGGDAIKKVRSLAVGAPEPVGRWLYSLADESWRVILANAKNHVNNEWYNQVYSRYKKGLEGRYPMQKQARDELAIFDFAEFFKTGGTIDGFVGEYLAPFIDVRRKWEPLSVDKRNMVFSNQSINQLKKADAIKKIFFQSNPEAPSVAFQLKPEHLPESVGSFELELGGQSVSYSHGPKFWQDVKWPDGEDTNHVRIAFKNLNNVETDSLEYDGPWAFFRLLDRSNLRSTSTSNVYNVSYSAGEQSAQFQIKAKSVNNPFSSNLLNSFDCPERL